MLRVCGARAGGTVARPSCSGLRRRRLPRRINAPERERQLRRNRPERREAAPGTEDVPDLACERQAAADGQARVEDPQARSFDGEAEVRLVLAFQLIRSRLSNVAISHSQVDGRTGGLIFERV